MKALKRSAALVMILMLLCAAVTPVAYAEEVSPAQQTEATGEGNGDASAETEAPTETTPQETTGGSAYVPSTTGNGQVSFSGAKTDFSDLQDLIAQVGDLREFDYTAESWENLMTVVKACNRVFQGSGQNTVNTAIINLQTAIEGLVPMNYTILEAALANYELILKENQLMHDAWVKLDEAVALAREQFSTGDQKAVDEAAAAVNALLAEREVYELPEPEPQIVTKEVQVEVLPTDDFCNIPMHRVWPVLFAASVVMNLVLAAALIFVLKHKSKQLDETPLVNYDIYDDMDDYT